MSEHSSKARWGQPLTGIIATVTFMAIALITWFIFASPQGIMKGYEHPFLEFLAWMILFGAWQHIIFGNWPFAKLQPILRGIVMIIVNVLVTYVIIYGVFQGFLGKVIIPLWSVDALVAQGISAEHAKEYVGGAITMFVLMGFVTYTFWSILFKKWPWGDKLNQPALGLAEWSLTTVITLLSYGVFIYPFYSTVILKQPLGGVAPWWGMIDGFAHLNYVVGIWEWMVIYLFMSTNIWSGKPFHLIKKQPWSGLVAIISIVLLSYATVKGLLLGMNMIWGPVDPTVANGTASLVWRYYNCAAIAAFFLFPFLIWNHYFDNWPQNCGSVVGWFVRTGIVTLLAAGQFALYYWVCSPLLGLPSEFSFANKPLVWLFWSIIPLLFNDWFMSKAPFYKSAAQNVEVPTSKNTSLN